MTRCARISEIFLMLHCVPERGDQTRGNRLVLRTSRTDYSVTSGDWVKKQFQARHFQPDVNLVQTQIKITSVKPNYEHSC
jgi:ABC-type thiamine transport system substrate-binding protein